MTPEVMKRKFAEDQFMMPIYEVEGEERDEISDNAPS